MRSTAELRFVTTAEASTQWLDDRMSELAGRRPVDTSRIAAPLLPLLSLDRVPPAERTLQAASHLERALRLVAALLAAKLAALHDAHLVGSPTISDEDRLRALGILRQARRRTDAIGTLLHLIDGLAGVLAPRHGFAALGLLLENGWSKKTETAAQSRNAAVHSGHHDFGGIAAKLEAVLKPFIGTIASPSVELLDVRDVHLDVTGAWPWSSVVAWQPVASAAVAPSAGRDDGRDGGRIGTESLRAPTVRGGLFP